MCWTKALLQARVGGVSRQIFEVDRGELSEELTFLNDATLPDDVAASDSVCGRLRLAQLRINQNNL